MSTHHAAQESLEQTADLAHLAACRGEDLTAALDAPFRWDYRDRPSDAAAEVTALVSNPHLSYDQFERLFAGALRQWVIYPGIDPEFQIDVDAPGERAKLWWHHLAVHADTAAANAGTEFRPWHRVWLLRRAFATGDPADWPELWRSTLGHSDSDQAARRQFVTLARHRSLSHERRSVVGASDDEVDQLMRDWDSPWRALRTRVPPLSSRGEAARRLQQMVGFDEPEEERAVVAASLRAAVLQSAVEGTVSLDHRGVETWSALLTSADQSALLSAPGICREESVDAWVNDARWWSNPRGAVVRAALGLFALDETTARRHVRCPVPRHRIALVLNPGCPEEIALAALKLGIDEADALLRSGEGLPPEGGDGLVETWWQVLMAVRGWFPHDDLDAAMRRVTGWMLTGKQPLRWTWHLAVTASRPDDLDGMRPEQAAAYDALLERLAETPMSRLERDGFRRDARDFGALTSPQMLRRLVASTGWTTSDLLVQPAILRVLADLPGELRVEAARRAEDSVLRKLVDDADPRVRQFLARNRRASAATLELLAADPDPAVRAQVARNTAVTAHCLTLLAADGTPRVAQAAGRALLRRLAKAG